MLEIIFVIWFSRKLSALASLKGQTKWWAALGVVFWFGGELMGGVLGALLGLETIGTYGLAILFAIVGAIVAWFIVSALPATKTSEPSW